MSETKRNFHEYLFANNILCGVHENDGRTVLNKLLAVLKRHFPELNIELATREVLAREELFPTVIAPGLAVPHARIPGLEAPLVAMACIPGGAAFNTDSPVVVMILLLTPVDEPDLHMQLLSALAGTFRKPEAIGEAAKLGTPAAVISYFSGNKIVIPDYLKARDVMAREVVTLRETDTLRDAIGRFATSREEELVVLDNTGDLRGVLALSDLLKFSLPEHLLWMEDLSPIYQFQPFSDMLKSAGDTRIADLMREEYIRVDENVPAIQLAKLFLVNKVRQLVITNGEGRLAGVVGLKDFTAKLFWN